MNLSHETRDNHACNLLAVSSCPVSWPLPYPENPQSAIGNQTMLTSIIAILAALVPLFVWLIRRHVTNEDDPYTQHTEKREQLAKEVVRNDETAANQSLDDDLEKLRALQKGGRQ